MLFQNKIEKYKSENRILSYIDETGFAFDMPRRYGYLKMGNRCYGTHNWNAKGRENVVNNSLTERGIVNGNVDSDTLDT